MNQDTIQLKSNLIQVLKSTRLDHERVDTLIHNCFESIKEVCSAYYQKGDVNPLRHLFMARGNIIYTESLILDIEFSFKNRIVPVILLPTLMLNKVVSELVSLEIHEIHRYFSCRSLSKLLRYFSIGGDFMANEYIRMKTREQLNADHFDSESQLSFEF